ncbi:chaperone dnaK [Cordyceps militaris]|uniref:Chaperone dnaK n=1 Tax=Cordyceps militaris TaxID=73501 RepID=A0A2H4SSP4_CORMI|nr:chaperone dnaK [Cordyceps militaris]
MMKFISLAEHGYFVRKISNCTSSDILCRERHHRTACAARIRDLRAGRTKEGLEPGPKVDRFGLWWLPGGAGQSRAPTCLEVDCQWRIVLGVCFTTLHVMPTTLSQTAVALR